MLDPKITIFAVLLLTMAMFVWGRWRHDMVAMAALLACVMTGLVPGSDAFSGFGHPAVITVACVLIISRGLQTSGAIDALTRAALPSHSGPTVSIMALTGLGALLSAFMNNVGALALLMPVALQISNKQGVPPGRILMPLSFGSILGGMTTLIGTPPNIIVARFRAEAAGEPFSMFDFTPVGLAVAAAGIAFIFLLGRWLVPERKRADVDSFEISPYLTEVRVPEKSKAVGMTLRQIESAFEDADAQVIGLVRDEFRIAAPNTARQVRKNDILVIESDTETLATMLSNLELQLAEGMQATNDADAEDKKAERSDDKIGDDETEKKKSPAVQNDDVVLMELAVLPASDFVGRSATDINLRKRFNINLLAVSRQGRRATTRLKRMRISAGDVLLLQGTPEGITEFASLYGCVPLAQRNLRIPDARQALIATAIMAAAVAATAFSLVSVAIAFAAAVLAYMALRIVSPRNVYTAVDWPVIVLLGAMIPVADAMASTGAADLLARFLIDTVAQGSAIVTLTLLLILAMTLSDFMNNAATAALMCPIAIGTASKLSLNADPFLIAVAIGASCAFLTPIGHQNNTLILGPGGFRFSDYWRLGLPLEIIVVAVAVPMILLVWPM